MKQTTARVLSLFLPIITIFILMQPVVTAVSPPHPTQNTVVARVYYDNISDLQQLVAYDLWEYNNLAEKYVLVSLSDDGYTQLESEGWRLAVDSEATAMLTPQPNQRTFNSGYRTVAEIYSALTAVANSSPMLTELVQYGDSYCQLQAGCTTPGADFLPGFDLLALRISNEAITGSSTISGTAVISGTKPVFFLLANIHAREITTPELAMRMIDWLLAGYGSNPDATWLVDWHEIWIVPIANPDGHWLVELGELNSGTPYFQRKNGHQEGCDIWPPYSFGQYGIDLNRNHSNHWGEASSSNECSQTYHGTMAASEPEVAQLEALVQALIPDQRGPFDSDKAPDNTTGIFITMHSYSELVLWPWGYAEDPAPNRDGLQAIGDKLATFNGYTSCQPTDCLYAASGTSDDWAYGELGVPAFTFEVGTQFMPPYSEIDEIQWPDNGPALQYAAKIARTPYQTVRGPDTTAVSLTVTNSLATLTAAFDETENGNSPIAKAVYAVGTPFWATGAITETMNAVDGSFDSPIETGTAVIDLNGFPPGRHLVFVKAQDSNGNWGPVSAIFLNSFSNQSYLPTIFNSIP